MKLIHDEWWTDELLIVDADGRVSFRGFYGTYQVTAGEFPAGFILSRDSVSPMGIKF